MKITHLYLENYGSFYGRHRIDLADRGLVSVLGDNRDETRMRSNGAGKSTWSDALDWALFGVVPRDDTADSVVNDLAGGSCCVTVDVLADDGTEIRVRRTRSYPGVPDGPVLLVGGVDKSGLDAKETQRRIEMALGVDREVFHAAVLFGQQDDFSFADATDGERKALLSRIIPELAELDHHSARVAEMLTEVSGKLAREQTRAQELTRQEADWLSRDPAAAAQAWELAHARELESRNAKYASAWHEFNAVAAEVARLPALLQPRPLPASVVDPRLAAARRNLQARVVELADALTVGRTRYRDAQTRLEKQRSSGALSLCPECKQPVTPEHAKTEQARLEQFLAKLRDEGLALASQHAAAVSELADVERQLAAQEAADSAARAEVAAHNAALEPERRAQDAIRSRHQLADRAAATALAELTREQQATNPWTAQVADYQGRLAALRADLARCLENVAALTKRTAALQFWVAGFGSKGLKSFVLDGRVAEMGAEANRWVTLLTGGTVWVEFATTREVGKGKQRRATEDLVINVYRTNPDGTVLKRNYRSWSGGEKYRIALGVDFGLSRLVSRRAKRPWDILILDELFQQSLDSAGKEAVAELLGQLSREKSSIFVIDHDALFQSMFNATMVVQKQNRRSRVVGGIHYDPESKDAAGDGGGKEILQANPAFPKPGQ